jgi:hypothetical protein
METKTTAVTGSSNASSKLVHLEIGNLVDVTFYALDTDAPRDYDGFGTIEVADYSYEKHVNRTVLVRDEYYDWQTMRYASGMHVFAATEHDVKHIEAELWKRVQNGGLK